MSCDCGLNQEIARSQERLASEAIAEASKYRTLWEAASSCIAANAEKIKPRGEDERRLISRSKTSDHGVFWSGKTNGWIPE